MVKKNMKMIETLNYIKNIFIILIINENYITNLLKGKDENEYPVLAKYLEYKNKKKSKGQKDNKDKFSLDNLNLFN